MCTIVEMSNITQDKLVHIFIQKNLVEIKYY